MKNSNISIRRARVDDIKAIYLLLKSFSDQKLLLAKTEDQLFRLIRGFRVIEDTKSKEIVACAHLDIFSEALAEVKSLAVMQDYQGQGLGAQLVLDCEDEARGMNIKKIFALTYQVAFFEKLLYLNFLPWE